MLEEIDLSQLSRDYSKQPWKNGENPVKRDFEYLYLALNLPAKEICKFMGISSSCLSRTLRGLGIYKNSTQKKESRKKCNIDTFGSPSPFGVPEIYNKGRETVLDKVGVLYKAQEHITNKEDLNEQYWRSHFIRNGLFLTKECREHHNLSKGSIRNYRKLFNITEPSKPVYELELSVANFLNSLGVKYETHNKTILNGLELDFYIPKYNLAIEMDGLLFHGCGFSKGGYVFEDDNGASQQRKPDLCRDRGITLLKIFEDEWKDTTKQRVWKSNIKRFLGLTKEVSTEDCRICEISYEVAIDFMLENSICDTMCGDKYYGWFYKGELIHVDCLFSTNNLYKTPEGKPITDVDLYAVECAIDKRDYTLVNPIRGLLDETEDIITGYFVNRRYPVREDLSDYNYELDHDSTSSAFYFKKHEGRRIPSEFITDEFKKYLPVQGEFETKEDMMRANGYMKIYDSGCEVYKRRYE